MPKLVGAVARDSSNLISDFWFSIVGKTEKVTELPKGTQFDIHVTYHATLSYIKDRTPDPPTLITSWAIEICAVCIPAQISLCNYDVTLYPGSSAGKTMILDKFNYWTNPAIMGDSDLPFTIYLIGSCASNLTVPTPDQLAQMPVQ